MECDDCLEMVVLLVGIVELSVTSVMTVSENFDELDLLIVELDSFEDS